MGRGFASAQELRPRKNTTWGHSTHGDPAYAVYHVIPDDDGTAVGCQRQLRMRGVGPPSAWNARARRKRLTVSRSRVEECFLGLTFADERRPHDMDHPRGLDGHRGSILWTSVGLPLILADPDERTEVKPAIRRPRKGDVANASRKNMPPGGIDAAAPVNGHRSLAAEAHACRD